MTTTERELLAKAREFDLDVLSNIYDSYSPGIFRYAMRLLGDTQRAEDCTSETFSRFLVALKNGGGPEDYLQAYLYRIAHNWITDFYRRENPAADDLDEDLISRDDDVDEAAARRAEQKRVRAALAVLTPEQRQVVALKFIEGWENQAIAQALEKPIGAVKSLQHRALGTLRRVLQLQEEQV